MCVNDFEPILCYFSSHYTSVNTASVVNWNGKHGETDGCKLAYRPVQEALLEVCWCRAFSSLYKKLIYTLSFIFFQTPTGGPKSIYLLKKSGSVSVYASLLCCHIILRFQYNNFSLTFSGPGSYAIKQGFISLEIKVAVDQLFIFVKLFWYSDVVKMHRWF